MKIKYFLKNDNSWVKATISYDDFSILGELSEMSFERPIGYLTWEEILHL